MTTKNSTAQFHFLLAFLQFQFFFVIIVEIWKTSFPINRPTSGGGVCIFLPTCVLKGAETDMDGFAEGEKQLVPAWHTLLPNARDAAAGSGVGWRLGVPALTASRASAAPLTHNSPQRVVSFLSKRCIHNTAMFVIYPITLLFTSSPLFSLI